MTTVIPKCPICLRIIEDAESLLCTLRFGICPDCFSATRVIIDNGISISDEEAKP